ncbi:unnamed protein product [Protopolystoma xenopodis]|uniref:Uncharacterized protein n=1 Tax=Protopolystoma xenopodis TaxID=117903 RepID=A0A3S5AM64_9PLAT|nr:unnamed protein product [Protopolystoma xenopodis]
MLFISFPPTGGENAGRENNSALTCYPWTSRNYTLYHQQHQQQMQLWRLPTPLGSNVPVPGVLGGPIGRDLVSSSPYHYVDSLCSYFAYIHKILLLLF